MKQYLPLFFLISGCMFSDEAQQKIETTNDAQKTPTKKPAEDKNIDKDPTTQPSTFQAFRFERSTEPLPLPYSSWEVDGDTLRSEVQGNLLSGFPDVTGNLDKIGDWVLGIEDPCINILKYEIVSIDTVGSVSAQRIGDSTSTGYSISADNEGAAEVIIRADFQGWERPDFAKSAEIKEGCEDPTYPEKLVLRYDLQVIEADGAVMVLPEKCSQTPTFSEETFLSMTSVATKGGQKLEALNWTSFPSLTTQHNKMDLGEEQVWMDGFLRMNQMKPGEVKIITEFGDEQIIRVAPFSETQSYKLIPFQGIKLPQEVDLNKLVRPWSIMFAFEDTEFLTRHCTALTPTIIETKTPDICVSEQAFSWGTYATTSIRFLTDEGECIIEASTSTEVIQRIAFEIGFPED